jgi:hypothetical protein
MATPTSRMPPTVCAPRARRTLAAALCAPLVLASSPLAAQRTSAPPEVRQIVTFLFAPAKVDSALAVYERVLIPAYRGDSAMRRFRGYREAESPQPLDLVVVSSFEGMAGMDRSNAALRQTLAGGRPVFAWYGTLASISQHHHDQFVEMRAGLGDSAVAAHDTAGGLTVFEYVRLAPASAAAWERLIASRVRAIERRGGVVRWSETGRLLVSDGWDYLRISRVASLGDWHAHQRALDADGTRNALDRVIAARKTIILRQVPALDVR